MQQGNSQIMQHYQGSQSGLFQSPPSGQFQSPPSGQFQKIGQQPYPQNQQTYPIPQQQYASSQQQVLNQVIVQKQTTYNQPVPHVHQYNVRVNTQQVQTPIPHIHQYNYQGQAQQSQTQIQQQTNQQIILPALNQNIQSTEQQIITREKQTIDYGNPIMRETYQIDRELQVISVEDVEEPWKRKCIELEVRIYDLETELSRFKNQNLTDQIYVDENRIQELEARNRKQNQIESDLREEMARLEDDLEDSKNRYRKILKDLQTAQENTEELRELRHTITERELDIVRQKEYLDQKDQENNELKEFVEKQNQDMEELERQLQDMRDEMSEFSETKTQVTYMTSEIASWKQKFKELNTTYHQVQEDLMLSQAELDSLRSQKTTIITTEKRTSNNYQTRSSNLRQQG